MLGLMFIATSHGGRGLFAGGGKLEYPGKTTAGMLGQTNRTDMNRTLAIADQITIQWSAALGRIHDPLRTSGPWDIWVYCIIDWQVDTIPPLQEQRRTWILGHDW